MNDETLPATPETAFTRSAAGYEYNGITLHKFTAQRQAAASTMGLRFGLVDESDIFNLSVETLKDGQRTKTDLQFYNQLFSDVITVLWLCTITESKVLRALRKPDEARVESFAWADIQGITLTSEQYYAAAGTFFQMMQDITVSTAAPKFERRDNDEDYGPNE